jgi:hypothetical protein
MAYGGGEELNSPGFGNTPNKNGRRFKPLEELDELNDDLELNNLPSMAPLGKLASLSRRRSSRISRNNFDNYFRTGINMNPF